MLKPLIAALILTASTAQANLTLKFVEGAPKDRFTLTNTGSCPLPAGTVTVDLSTAAGGLIFDVTGSGAGVEVFQPFEVVAGAGALRALPRVRDGDSMIELRLNGLDAGQSIAFTIDVDDTGGGREITVNGSEIAGATLRTQVNGMMSSARVGSDARATALIEACLS